MKIKRTYAQIIVALLLIILLVGLIIPMSNKLQITIIAPKELSKVPFLIESDVRVVKVPVISYLLSKKYIFDVIGSPSAFGSYDVIINYETNQTFTLSSVSTEKVIIIMKPSAVGFEIPKYVNVTVNKFNYEEQIAVIR